MSHLSPSDIHTAYWSGALHTHICRCGAHWPCYIGGCQAPEEFSCPACFDRELERIGALELDALPGWPMMLGVVAAAVLITVSFFWAVAGALG
jgi:hypothetical protein